VLSRRFARMLKHENFRSNEGFSGFSEFGAIPYAREFDSFLIAPGRRPMIMCHPGLTEEGIGGDDAIAARRPEEYGFLSTRPQLDALVWRPVRQADSGILEWPERLA
jgi:hypothetical protein